MNPSDAVALPEPKEFRVIAIVAKGMRNTSKVNNNDTLTVNPPQSSIIPESVMPEAICERTSD